tara:strand:- start:4574 stop:4858 length:285 start_codon:yes stop_codon:yes gene_type:complete
MGFKAAKAALINALKNGNYQHAERGSIDVKNLLAIGRVTAEELIEVIKRCDGTQHSCSKHHQVKELDVHLIKCNEWYVRFFFITPDVWFISVHQ